jgi:hypothetical protein
MNGEGPNFWGRLAIALGLAIGTAALMVALVGKPTWGVRAGALGLILAVVVLVLVWHWGFSRGTKSARPRDE